MISVGGKIDPADLGAAPANTRVLPWVPQLAVTPGTLRSAVLALDDPAVRARAAELRGELQAAGGASRAADLVEAELR